MQTIASLDTTPSTDHARPTLIASAVDFVRAFRFALRQTAIDLDRAQAARGAFRTAAAGLSD